MAKRIYNQTALFGPLYAYLLVISPPRELELRLQQIKLSLHERFPLGKSNMQSKPHITLFERLTDETALAETVKVILSKEQTFTVNVEEFVLFEHQRYSSIVLTVTPPEPILRLHQRLKTGQKAPFLTFAKWLRPEQAMIYMEYLNTLDFQASWTCSGLLLLRKLMSEKHLGFREKTVITLHPS